MEEWIRIKAILEVIRGASKSAREGHISQLNPDWVEARAKEAIELWETIENERRS